MTRHTDKTKALAMRKKGMSYSAIKEKLGISKSTLSYWLSDLPLSREQINTLRAHSPKRIERFRNTMQKKRDERITQVYQNVSSTIGDLSPREKLIAGLFLYWGEGGKTKSYSITLANTDPQMIRFYLMWVRLLKVPDEKIKIRLHLYSDMNIGKEIAYWVKTIQLSKKHFVKPYIKASKIENLSYRGFGHGTCNVIVDNRDISEWVLQGLKYIAE